MGLLDSSSWYNIMMDFEAHGGEIASTGFYQLCVLFSHTEELDHVGPASGLDPAPGALWHRAGKAVETSTGDRCRAAV